MTVTSSKSTTINHVNNLVSNIAEMLTDDFVVNLLDVAMFSTQLVNLQIFPEASKRAQVPIQDRPLSLVRIAREKRQVLPRNKNPINQPTTIRFQIVPYEPARVFMSSDG